MPDVRALLQAVGLDRSQSDPFIVKACVQGCGLHVRSRKLSVGHADEMVVEVVVAT